MPHESHDSMDHRRFFESTPFVPWEYDVRSGRTEWVGPRAVNLLGYAVAEWLEPTFWTDHILPDDQARVMEARAELQAGRESHVIEYRMEHADGHLVWVSEAVHVLRVDGEVATLRGLLSDVTDRKRLELSLAESEERFRVLWRAAPDAMVLTEDDGTIVSFNDQAEHLFDYASKEVAGSSVDHLVPGRLQGRLRGHRRAFDRDPARQSLVDPHSFAIKRRDGAEVPVELSVSSVPTIGGRQFLYVVRDLTARRRVEAQLESGERRLRGMADALPALVCFVDADQRYRFVNEAYAAWAGWDRNQMEGRLVREVVGETTYADLRPSIEAVLTGQAMRFAVEVSPEKGIERPVDVSYVPHFEGDEVVGYFVVVVELRLDGGEPDSMSPYRMDRIATGRSMPGGTAGGP